MGYSRTKFISAGSSSVFPVSFGYLSKSHVEVYVDGVLQNSLTWLNDYTVQLPAVPPSGAIVQLRRNTTKDGRLVDFQDGSVLTEKALDTDSNQLFYLSQEAFDEAGEALKEDSGGNLDAKGRRITNLGEPVGQQDAVTKHTLEYQYPDVQVVAAHIADLHTVAADLTVAGLSIQDMGTIDAPLSGTPAGTGYVATVGSNMALVTSVANNMGAITTAGDNATAAATSASSALTSKNAAAASATAAATSETNALSSKNAAATSATNAAASATAAATSATTASTKAGDASSSATAAATSATAAATSASSADSSKTLSSDWAQKTGATVDGSGYSAKYWALQAQSYAGGGVTSFNTRNGAVTLTSSDVTTALGFTPLSAVADGSITAAKLSTTLDLGTVP